VSGAGQPAPRAQRARPTAGWRTVAGTGTSASAALAALVLVAVFVAMALPRASLSLRTNALQQVFAQLPPTAKTMSASINFESFAQAAGGGNLAGQLSDTRAELAGQMTAAGVPIVSRQAWTSLDTGPLPTSGASPRAYYGAGAPQFGLVYRDALAHYARLKAGTWPTGTIRRGRDTVYQLAVTARTAARFRLGVGSSLTVGPGVRLQVSGLVIPMQPRSAFWTQNSGLDGPYFTSTAAGGYWTGEGFVGAGGLPTLLAGEVSVNAQVTWVYPLNLGAVTANNAGGLIQAVNKAAGQGETIFNGPTGTGAGLSVTSGVTQSIATFETTEQQVTSILSLLFVSLAVLGVVVLLLCTQLVIDRREEEFTIMRARGATRWQLGWLTLRGGLLTAVPAALAGIALAIVITPGGGNSLAWGLAIGSGLAGLLGPAALAARRDPTGHRAGGGRWAFRGGALRKVAGLRRLTVELALTGLAVAGLIVLRQQGLSASGSVNGLASAGPVLVAVPAAIIMVRLCPVVLGWLMRVAGRSRGVVAFVGLARGAQRAAGALLPVFALVLALAVVAFGGTVRAAVSRGQEAASWQLTGADAAVGSPGSTIGLPAPARRAMAAVRGVDRVAPIIELTGFNGQYVTNSTQINVAVVNPSQYAAVLAGTPAPAFPAADLARPPAGSPVPVIASPAAAALLRASGGVANVNENVIHLVVKAEVGYTPAVPADAPFMVLPWWAAAGNLTPTMLLLSGSHINQAALSSVVARDTPGTSVAFRTQVLASLASAPLPRATYVAYAEGSGAAALFSVLVVLISLMLGARSRELVDARLSTMGLSAWQARRVGFVEAIPVIVAAAIGGVIAVIVLVPLISPVLDLSVFTGTTGSVQIRPDIPTLLAGAGGLVVLALVTLAVQAAAARRRGIGRALRVGD
jgi:putative ABC transport system permease protein